ncbi:MAG TPA: YggS family pyridoxal phosphate-dependent enzyme [Bacteroidales bacterium]|nr:YggS family pyridoxal phosphate-dependent enzyme [Bacteroidales bacterium]
MKIANNYLKIRQQIANRAKLIAVSKYQPNEALLEAYNAGCKVFGENKVQELVQKHAALPTDIEWHLIGHLQSNKVKYIASFVTCIHSVDSYKLLKAIDKEAEKCGRVIPCLLQMYIAKEETKFGLDYAELIELIESFKADNLQNVQLVGLMGMATFTENMEQVAEEFLELHRIFLAIKEKYFYSKVEFNEISMGMSGDYMLAIEHGSTMVRVGTGIFGERK